MIYKYGGTYIDTDFLLLRPIDADIFNSAALGVETFDDKDPQSSTFHSLRINNAFLTAPPKHPFVEYLLHKIEANYNPNEWAAIGPELITRSYISQPESVQHTIQLLFPNVLYPLHWARAHAILRLDHSMIDIDWPVEKRKDTIGVHLYNSNSFRHECYEETCSYYRLHEAPKGSLLEIYIDRVRVESCDALRIPPLEARQRTQYNIDKVTDALSQQPSHENEMVLKIAQEHAASVSSKMAAFYKETHLIQTTVPVQVKWSPK